MAHAEEQGKAVYKSKAEAGASAAASRFEKPSEAPAAKAIGDYQAYIYDGGDFTSL